MKYRESLSVSALFKEEYAYELRANEGIKEKLFDKYSEYTNRYIEKYKVYLERFLFRSTLMTSLSYLIYWAVLCLAE